MEQVLERRVRVIPATRNTPRARGPRQGRQRVAAYCRVSTDSEEQLNSYEAQKDYYTQRIEENPDWEMAGIFADKGLSGTSMKKRTEFNKMIAACKRGRIDTILTKSLFRFARNTVDCLETVRRIYRRYLDGCSLIQIEQELETDHVPTAQGIQGWSRQVIQNILTNERYIGDALLGKTYVTNCISKEVRKNNGERPMWYVENNRPAIIPKKLFYRVQEEMTRRASKRKVMQKSGKTELGKYSAKYALSELLVCGECGTPYKRVTWARNGKKRIVWRCVSRLEFGTKYCHSSPTLDEEKLHRAILETLNEFAQADTEVKADMLEFTALAWNGGESNGTSLIALRQKLKDITAQQALLLDQVLENMDDSDLTAQLKTLIDEKQATQDQISKLELDEIHNANQASRMAELKEWMAKLEVNTEYNDEQVRMAIEKITVLDAETIHIKFKHPGLEMDKKLN